MMKSFVSSFLIGFVLAFLSVAAGADDEIAVRYREWHSRPDQSSEWIELHVSRPSSPPAVRETSKQDVDLFFQRVSAVLAANGVSEDWQLVLPDAPSIEMVIDIHGKRLKLASSHVGLERDGTYVLTECGLHAIRNEERGSVLAEQSDSFRRHRRAFEAILRLTLDRVTARLSQ